MEDADNYKPVHTESERIGPTVADLETLATLRGLREMSALLAEVRRDDVEVDRLPGVWL